jgi:hypothetical protein
MSVEQTADPILSKAMAASAGSTALVQTVDALQKVCLTTDSTQMTGEYKGNGWSSIHMSAHIRKSSFETHKQMVDSFERQVNNISDMPKQIASCLKNIIVDMRNGQLREAGQSILKMEYTNLKGQVCGIYVWFTKQRFEGELEYFLGTSFVEGHFERVTDYIVLTHTKSNFFSSKTTVEIVKAPIKSQGITTQDIQNLLTVLIGPVYTEFKQIESK